MKTALKFVLLFLLVGGLVMLIPFFGFGKSLEAVAADAARLFGISPDEYTLTIERGRVVTAAGESVNGMIWSTMDARGNFHFDITIRRSISRPFTIATIFHEFAHAAQSKFNLCYGEFTSEQHAELLAFHMMMRSNYWWNGLHMLMTHSFRTKPSDYLVAGTLWNMAFTGNSPVYI